MARDLDLPAVFYQPSGPVVPMGELHLDDPPTKGTPFTGLMQVSIFDQDHRCHVLRSAMRTMFCAGVLDPHATIILIVGANVVKVLRMPCLEADTRVLSSHT